MLPGNGIRNADKTCYTTETQYAFQHTGLNTNEIKEYIRNPHKFNIKPEMDGQYYNLWSTDNDKTDANDEVVIKRVYDPSPVGYSLPASNAFTGFTTIGGYTDNPSDWNVKGNFDNGWYFYTKPNKKGSTVFFLASGCRNYNSGSLYSVPPHGDYWSAEPADTSRSRYYYLTLDSVAPLYNLYRNYGFPVRSAEEKKLKYELDEIANGVWVNGGL